MTVSQCHYRNLHRAFTLTELLVVLVIVAALAALTLPVLLRARDRARVTTCASNLGQLYQAFALYAQDNDGKLPPYQNVTGSGWGCNSPACGGKWHIDIPARGKELTAALKPYTKSNALWFCPADYLARTDDDDGFISHRYASYKASSWLGKQGFPQFGFAVTLDGVTEKGVLEPQRAAAEVILLHDNLWPHQNHHPHAFKPLYSHANRFNYLYLDGHIKTHPWNDFEP